MRFANLDFALLIERLNIEFASAALSELSRPTCTWQACMCSAVLLFSKLSKLFFGYFDPDFFFLIMKINNCQGDLADVSAKKEALV